MVGTLWTLAALGYHPGVKMDASRKFDTLLASTNLPIPALTFVESPSDRIQLRGAAAVEEDELVRRSFEILYEDLAFFRPAANLLIRRLATVASTANSLYSSLDGTVSDAVLPRLRGLFDAIDQDGDGALEPDELLAAAARLWPPGKAAKACLDADGGEGCSISYSFTDFARLIGPQQMEPWVTVGTATFPHGALTAHAAGSRAAQGVSPDGAIAERIATAAALASEGGSGSEGGSSASGWGSRFDRMAHEFLTWEADNSWDGRRGEIVTGCFAGARNAALLCALRQVYCENAVLRSGGDVVFRMLRPPSHRRA